MAGCLAVGGLRLIRSAERSGQDKRYAAGFRTGCSKGRQNLLTAQEMKTLRQLADQLLTVSQVEPGSISQARNLQDQLTEFAALL